MIMIKAVKDSCRSILNDSISENNGDNNDNDKGSEGQL